MKFSAITILITFLFLNLPSFAQVTGEIEGIVIDEHSESTIPFATILLLNDGEIIGTAGNEAGEFSINNIPVGRYNIQVRSVGYQPVELNGVLVTSGRTQYLTIRVSESVYALEALLVSPQQEKQNPLNSMATVSSKQLSMEEANRFAGGFDDPARLVSSFAGVASNVTTNGIVVRGNSPKGVLWRMEGVPIPNPNHFAEVTGFGGGGITALSSKMLSDSDFFTAAFPAEYGNALSAVFDLSIRNGNNAHHEHSAELGLLGFDISSEGPFSKSGNASYLANYRYSTFGLVDQLISDDVFGITYQDFLFKLHFPTEKAGVFSVWGLALTDASNSNPDTDTTATDATWKYYDDITTENTQQSSGIVGISHKYAIGNNGFINSSLTGSVTDIFSETSRLDSTFTTSFPTDRIEYNTTDLQISSVLNYKFGTVHTNRTGFIFTNLSYDFELAEAPEFGNNLETFANDDGRSNLLQAYTQSSFNVTDKLQVNPGIHLLYFSLNGNYSIEPRFAASYQINDKSGFSAGYGLHSQLEKLSFYLSDIPQNSITRQLNKNLDFSKAHHIVVGYNLMITGNTHLKIEPYYQYLFDLPVIDNSYFSMINLTDDFFINDELINKGTGKNLGVDVTLERFLDNGWYYLLTLSLFDSNYTGGDGIERDTRFNRQVLSNVLFGKEWSINQKNLLNASFKYTYLGGNRTHPVDTQASLAQKEIIEDFSDPYGIKNPDSHVLSLTFTYRINKDNRSSHWTLQIINLLGAKEYLGYQYNFLDHTVERNTDAVFLPNLSYKIEF